jgi:heat shock protein HtpX
MFIVSPLSGKDMMSLFSTHPPMEKRIAALMALRGTLV